MSKPFVFKVLKLGPIVNNASKKYTLNLKKKNLKTPDHKYVKERLVRVAHVAQDVGSLQSTSWPKNHRGKVVYK